MTRAAAVVRILALRGRQCAVKRLPQWRLGRADRSSAAFAGITVDAL
jgi:hypothetical protein